MDDRMHIHSIEALGSGKYKVRVVSDANFVLESVCAIVRIPYEEGDPVKIINCDSESFNKASSMGLIDSKKIASALFAFEMAEKP